MTKRCRHEWTAWVWCEGTLYTSLNRRGPAYRRYCVRKGCHKEQTAKELKKS